MRVYIHTYTSCLQYNALYNAMYDVCDPNKIYLRKTKTKKYEKKSIGKKKQ